MKREARAVYVALANEVDAQLCCFCKSHDAIMCGDVGCSHPLPVSDDEVYPGDDCWGFRPKVKVPDLADIVGIVLSNGWQSWRYELGDPIKVSGTKEI